MKTDFEVVMSIGDERSVSNQEFLKVYLEKQHVLMELPISLLNQDIILVRHDHEYRVEQKHVYWFRHENEILLASKRIYSQSDFAIPLNNNVTGDRNVLAKFPINLDRSDFATLIIDITTLFLNTNLNWQSDSDHPLVNDLSFIKKVYSLQNEILIRAELTTLEKHVKVSRTIDFSMYKLPDPMVPRLFDYRMGFDVEDNSTFIQDKALHNRANITRWRLEKKYPNKALSVPVLPIIFYLTPDIPKKWRPYVKSGILEWLPAFEAAGFQGAIEVRDPLCEDSLFELNSVNYSKVHWGKYRGLRGYEDAGSATISKVIDKRTGEILKSDIIFNSTLQYLADSYFIRCSPIDIRAQKFPFPDKLLGALIQSVIAHEAGHSLGIIDANFGEYTYNINQLRDENWLKKMGHTASVMNYDRYHFIPQPEDSISPDFLIPKVGPADIYSITWGYTPILNSYKKEQRVLEDLIRQQDSILWFRFNRVHHEIIGPASTNEVVASKDPIQSISLGLKNLERTMELIPMINGSVQDYTIMERLYDKVVALWFNQIKFIISLLGGYTIQYKSTGQLGDIYTAIPEAEQREALAYVLPLIFNPPTWLIAPEWKQNYTYTSYPDVVLEKQILLLFDLIQQQRMKRIEYLEDTKLYTNYTQNYISEIMTHLFSEFSQDNMIVTPRKQALQRQFVLKIIQGLKEETPVVMAKKNYTNYSQNTQSLFNNELPLLKNKISKKMIEVKDGSTQGHLKLLLKTLNDY
ncbi:zinc-dependent metalloprotease [Formosa sp. 3Alg 14/1]|uniref:zinc-dependent metalloprotease n=1 Tax=Formosa sp. 3Alg 14/1 TaxID=3382190 RepID=UPI0039BDB7C5